MSQKITKIVTSSISYEEIKKGDIVEIITPTFLIHKIEVKDLPLERG